MTKLLIPALLLALPLCAADLKFKKYTLTEEFVAWMRATGEVSLPTHSIMPFIFVPLKSSE